MAGIGTGGYFAGSAYLRNKEITEKVEPYNGLFCPGVYVDGINLGGMTPEQALNSVQSQIQQRHDAWTVQLTYNGEQVAEINADMLDFNVDPNGVLNEAWQQGHRTATRNSVTKPCFSWNSSPTWPIQPSRTAIPVSDGLHHGKRYG